MSKNLLVINVDFRETRVALIENGIIVEFHIERASEERCLGNVVLGRVTRVLPGMQAAFIDVGLDKAAFLHVEDLIRPDDLEAYLAGHKGKHERDENAPALPEPPAEPPPGHPAELAPVPGATKSAEIPQDRASGEVPVERVSGEIPEASIVDVPEVEEDEQPTLIPPPVAAGPIAVPPAAVSSGPILAPPEAAASGPVVLPPEAAASGPVAEDAVAAAEEGEAAAEDDELDVDMLGDADLEGDDLAAPETTVSGTAPVGDGAGAADNAQRPRGRRRRRGGRGRSKDDKKEETVVVKEAARQAPKPQEKSGRGGKRDNKGELPRIDKNTPIRDVVREGQEVLVQISKEPIGTKGARVTSHISLPGRYVVYLPTVDYVGVSKRIGSEKERHRLRETIDGMKPPSGGLIIRTLAEGLTKKQLKADVGYLVRLWGEIVKKREGARGPVLLFEELDLILKVARDMFGDDVEKIVIDDKAQYDRLSRFVEMFMPERVKDVELYAGEEPIFDAYGIEEEIQRALSRKVPLPSGGYLIIDEAEALTAIDVNTGRYVGKGSKDHEETILKTNLEAVEEIAYQLRFRNLGGLIVLDLIDMDRASSREHVRRRLEDLLQKDKAKTSLNRISELGLIEMTRKRTRESLGRILHEPCFYCDGTGQIQAKTTVVYEILRAIRRDRTGLPGYTIVVNAHPDVVQLMKTDEKEAVRDAEKRYMRRIDLIPRKEYHLEQYELAGR